MFEIVIKTILPIFLLIALGAFAKARGIFKSGDEKVFSSYIYYFSLPALFLINLSETKFTIETIRFVGAAISPIFIVLLIFLAIGLVFRLKNRTTALFISSSLFGSTAFFGVPFVIFAFNNLLEERLAVLTAAVISAVAVVIVTLTLEIYSGQGGGAKKFLKNPLLLSIFLGIIVSLSGFELPVYFASALHMLGKTTATVAIFMLGIFLWGRTYKNIFKAGLLSLLRIILMPTVALLVVGLFNLHGAEAKMIVLMHAMPLAVSMIVLSNRYKFEEETIASEILITSLLSVIYLNVWLWFLN